MAAPSQLTPAQDPVTGEKRPAWIAKQPLGDGRQFADSRLVRRFGEVLASIRETRQWIPVLLDYIGH